MLRSCSAATPTPAAASQTDPGPTASPELKAVEPLDKVTIQVPMDAKPGQTVSFRVSKTWADARPKIKAVGAFQSLLLGREERQITNRIKHARGAAEEAKLATRLS